MGSPLRMTFGRTDWAIPGLQIEHRELLTDLLDPMELSRTPLHWLQGAFLAEGAFESKRKHKGDVVTVSRNVFIPLTNLCRNRCTYCGFAKAPDSAEAHTYTLEEVAKVVEGGVASAQVKANGRAPMAARSESAASMARRPSVRG